MLKLSKTKLNRIEGIGLILILLAFFIQVIESDLQNSKQEIQFYSIHKKLDYIWALVETDYSEHHPDDGIHTALNFQPFHENWKIYSEQIKEIESWEGDINLFSRLGTWIFIIGTALLIVPKFIDEKGI